MLELKKNNENSCQENQINNNQESVAKRRWGLLAKALQKPSQLNKHLDYISLRRFSSYTLIEYESCIIDGHEWFKYVARIDREYWVLINHPRLILTPAELTGFNNTGNICVWPSEEILAYYALANPQLFINRNVLELGGGMSCLAGLMVARHLHPSYVHLTDGNVTAVKNVYQSLKINFTDSERTFFTCSVLKWDRNEKDCEEIRKYDVILCADCCFFDESREDLIQCIWNRLSDTGLALIMAPKRGNTLQEFMIQAKLHGFICRKMIYYNKNVWDRHVALLENPDYNENIHFPLLIYLRKDVNSNR